MADPHISMKLIYLYRFRCQYQCLVILMLLMHRLSATTPRALCPHPAVPNAGSYVTLSGGSNESAWIIKYICDNGYVLFGSENRTCHDAIWNIVEPVPHCAVNIALFKPTLTSSTQTSDLNGPNNAVDGKKGVIHGGNQCTETKLEKSPWWMVDLLGAHSVSHVRLITRCCDDMVIKKAEIRVGNSTLPGENPLCNWIPQALPEGSTETIECAEKLVGRYVSISMTGVENVLSLCEVEVYSIDGKDVNHQSCYAADFDFESRELAVFQGNCYRFISVEQVGFDQAATACQKIGYTLVDQLTVDTTKYITSQLEYRKKEANIKGKMIWIGAKRKTDGSWNWITNKNSDTDDDVQSINWGKGQPNNYNSQQNCAVLDSAYDWRWNDISCRISAYAVCRGETSMCPSPPVGENSKVTGNRKKGDLITYTCSTGQMPIGDIIQVCGNDGRWNGSAIKCKKVECGQVEGLANGEVHVIDGRTTWGARVRYKCKEKYSLMKGNSERVCEENGWSGISPECVFSSCPNVSDVPNSTFTVIGKLPHELGNKIVYKCLEGFKPIGSLTKECVAGGLWSGVPLKCEFIDCGPPPHLEHGTIVEISNGHSFGSKVSYSCASDYILSGINYRKCEGHGEWSKSLISCNLIECKPPYAPNGGRVSGYNRKIHARIEFSCLKGHVLEGPSELKCTNAGIWSGSEPTCRYIDCGSVPPIQYGTAHYLNGTTDLGSIVQYTCDKSYTFSGGTSNRVCLKSLRWSGDEPTCSEIRCPLPPTRPNNTIINVSSSERLHGTSVIRSSKSSNNMLRKSYRVGSTLKYRCERGHILRHKDGTDMRVMTRRCTKSGLWTGSTPSCKYVDCGMPNVSKNGKVKMANNGTFFGTIAFYSCKENFKLDGFKKRRCGSSGLWEPVNPPECVETLCDSISSPGNGSMILTTLRIGGTATFTCHDGFLLTGDNDLECLSSGSWSSWPPSCIEINCGQPDQVENGRTFLANGSSTAIGSIVEYHCFPGYDRTGPFRRVCGSDGYWSGIEPSCQKPHETNIIPNRRNKINIWSSKNRRGSRNQDDDESNKNEGVGVYIGVALGLFVILGLVGFGIYFYRKQRVLATKPLTPAPFSERNGIGNPYMSSAGNRRMCSPPVRPPPPPIQMYSMEDDSGFSTVGPIYDTIKEDPISANGRYMKGTPGGGVNQFPYGQTATVNSGRGSKLNFINDYDTVSGNVNDESPNSDSVPPGSVGTVTINGISV